MFLWCFSGGSSCQVRSPAPWRSASGEKPAGRGDAEGDQRPGQQPSPPRRAGHRRGDTWQCVFHPQGSSELSPSPAQAAT